MGSKAAPVRLYVVLTRDALSQQTHVVYSMTWDFVKDWGLGDRSARMLRKEKFYPTW